MSTLWNKKNMKKSMSFFFLLKKKWAINLFHKWIVEKHLSFFFHLKINLFVCLFFLSLKGSLFSKFFLFTFFLFFYFWYVEQTRYKLTDKVLKGADVLPIFYIFRLGTNDSWEFNVNKSLVFLFIVFIKFVCLLSVKLLKGCQNFCVFLYLFFFFWFNTCCEFVI